MVKACYIHAKSGTTLQVRRYRRKDSDILTNQNENCRVENAESRVQTGDNRKYPKHKKRKGKGCELKKRNATNDASSNQKEVQLHDAIVQHSRDKHESNLSSERTTKPSNLLRHLWRKKSCAEIGSDICDTNQIDEEIAFVKDSHHFQKRATREFESSLKIKDYTIGTSSQDTQSASEDDYLIETKTSANGSICNLISFPSICSIDEIQDKNRVEIVIKDFNFQPQHALIGVGEYLVWKVSSATLSMVEHCFDIVYTHATSQEQVKLTTPVLCAGHAIVTRFTRPGHVRIECSVYHTTGTIEVVAKRKEKIALNDAHTGERNLHASLPTKEHLNGVLENAATLPKDVLVCNEKERQRTMAQASTEVCENKVSEEYINIGEVECPVLQNVTKMSIQTVLPVEETDCNTDIRSRFLVLNSGFDAGAAYDFFKQRFNKVRMEGAMALF